MAYTSEIDKLERRLRENPTGLTFAPLAEQYRKAGDVARALEVLKTGLEYHPTYVAGNIVFGRCNFDLGNYPEAEAAFRRVLESDSENVIALQALADIAERENRFDDSSHWLDYLLTIDAGNDQARKQMARLNTLREQHEQVNPPPLDGETAPAGGINEAVDPAGSEPVAVSPVSPVEESPDSDATIEIQPARAAAPSPDAFAEEEKTDFLLDEEPIGEPTANLERFDMGVERHEEIVLRPSATSEFQAPSDAELLSAARMSGGFTPEFEEDAPVASVKESSSSPDIAAPPPQPVSSEALWQAHPEDTTLRYEEPPVPTPEPIESLAEEPGKPDEPRVLEKATPLPEELAGEAEEEETAPAAEAGQEPLVTETIGDVYAAQGHDAQALEVYRQLLLRSPGDARLAEKIRELEHRARPAVAQASAAFAAEQTGGQSVKSYFGDLLAARLPGSNGSTLSSEPASSESSSTRFMEEAFKTDEEPSGGEPTRPASGPLSLSAIFGEDPSPVPPVVSSPDKANPEAAPSHFDEFFAEQSAGSGSTTRTRSIRLETDQDDLEQFHKWLKGLKR